MIMKQEKEKFDFKAFGQAIKSSKKSKGNITQSVSRHAEYCAPIYRVH